MCFITNLHEHKHIRFENLKKDHVYVIVQFVLSIFNFVHIVHIWLENYSYLNFVDISEHFIDCL